MPGGDKTGPAGFGPGTGRRLGYCSGNNQPGFTVPGMGQRRHASMRRGFNGCGFGWERRRNNFEMQNSTDPNVEVNLASVVTTLEEKISLLEKKLDALNPHKEE